MDKLIEAMADLGIEKEEIWEEESGFVRRGGKIVPRTKNKVREGSRGSNNKMFKNALSALARQNQDIHKKHRLVSKDRDALKVKVASLKKSLNNMQLHARRENEAQGHGVGGGGTGNSSQHGRMSRNQLDRTAASSSSSSSGSTLGGSRSDGAQIKHAVSEGSRGLGGKATGGSEDRSSARRGTYWGYTNDPGNERLKKMISGKAAEMEMQMSGDTANAAAFVAGDVDPEAVEHMVMTALQFAEQKENTGEVVGELAKKLKDIMQAGLDIPTNLSIEAVLDYCMQRTCDIMNCDRASLYIVDVDKGFMWTKLGTMSPEIKIPIGKGIAGIVADSGRPCYIYDAYSDPRFNSKVDAATGYRTRNLMVIPVKDKDGVVRAVLQVINKLDDAGDTGAGVQFSDIDKIVLNLLGSQWGILVSYAFYNSRVLQSDSDVQSLLSMPRFLYGNMSTRGTIHDDIDMAKLIRRAEEQARRTFNAPYAKVFLAEEIEIVEDDDTAMRREFDRGQKDPNLRLMSLKEAWGMGAGQWETGETVRYYSPMGVRGGIAGQCGATQAMMFRTSPSNDLHYNGNVDLDTKGLAMYAAPIKSFMDESLVGVLQIALPVGFEPEEEMLRNNNATGDESGQPRDGGGSDFENGYSKTIMRFCGMAGMVLGCSQLINKARNHDITKNSEEMQTLFEMWQRKSDQDKAIAAGSVEIYEGNQGFGAPTASEAKEEAKAGDASTAAAAAAAAAAGGGGAAPPHVWGATDTVAEDSSAVRRTGSSAGMIVMERQLEGEMARAESEKARAEFHAEELAQERREHALLRENMVQPHEHEEAKLQVALKEAAVEQALLQVAELRQQLAEYAAGHDKVAGERDAWRMKAVRAQAEADSAARREGGVDVSVARIRSDAEVRIIELTTQLEMRSLAEEEAARKHDVLEARAVAAESHAASAMAVTASAVADAAETTAAAAAAADDHAEQLDAAAADKAAANPRKRESLARAHAHIADLQQQLEGRPGSSSSDRAPSPSAKKRIQRSPSRGGVTTTPPSSSSQAAVGATPLQPNASKKLTRGSGGAAAVEAKPQPAGPPPGHAAVADARAQPAQPPTTASKLTRGSGDAGSPPRDAAPQADVAAPSERSTAKKLTRGSGGVAAADGKPQPAGPPPGHTAAVDAASAVGGEHHVPVSTAQSPAAQHVGAEAKSDLPAAASAPATHQEAADIVAPLAPTALRPAAAQPILLRRESTIVDESVFNTTLRVVFDLIDTHKTNSLSRRELLDGVMHNQDVQNIVHSHVSLLELLRPKTVLQVFTDMDTDVDGHVSFDEFVSFAVYDFDNRRAVEKNELVRSMLRRVFDQIDLHGSDSVERGELMKVMRSSSTAKDILKAFHTLSVMMHPGRCADAFKALDPERNGQITFAHFANFCGHDAPRHIREQNADKARAAKEAKANEAAEAAEKNAFDTAEAGDADKGKDGDTAAAAAAAAVAEAAAKEEAEVLLVASQEETARAKARAQVLNLEKKKREAAEVAGSDIHLIKGRGRAPVKKKSSGGNLLKKKKSAPAVTAEAVATEATEEIAVVAMVETEATAAVATEAVAAETKEESATAATAETVVKDEVAAEAVAIEAKEEHAAEAVVAEEKEESAAAAMAVVESPPVAVLSETGNAGVANEESSAGTGLNINLQRVSTPSVVVPPTPPPIPKELETKFAEAASLHVSTSTDAEVAAQVAAQQYSVDNVDTGGGAEDYLPASEDHLEPLPVPWERHYDESGHLYYYHPLTGESAVSELTQKRNPAKHD